MLKDRNDTNPLGSTDFRFGEFSNDKIGCVGEMRIDTGPSAIAFGNPKMDYLSVTEDGRFCMELNVQINE
jgi:hypothetical protein